MIVILFPFFLFLCELELIAKFLFFIFHLFHSISWPFFGWFFDLVWLCFVYFFFSVGEKVGWSVGFFLALTFHLISIIFTHILFWHFYFWRAFRLICYSVSLQNFCLDFFKQKLRTQKIKTKNSPFPNHFYEPLSAFNCLGVAQNNHCETTATICDDNSTHIATTATTTVPAISKQRHQHMCC